MIIGLTGTLAAGKGTVAKYLEKKGFVYHSLSDILREELKKRKLKENRCMLQDLGDEIRMKFGNGELARRILKKIRSKNEKNSVVDSIRHPEEVKVLKREKDFILITLDAPIKLRYERLKIRKRLGDENVSFEKFKSQEDREMATFGSGQQLGICMKMADYTIINNGTMEDLYNKIKEILK